MEIVSYFSHRFLYMEQTSKVTKSGSQKTLSSKKAITNLEKWKVAYKRNTKILDLKIMNYNFNAF